MLVLCTGMSFYTKAQTQAQAIDSARRLNIIDAARQHFQNKDSLGTFVSLAGHVKLRQEGTLFYCDSAVLNQKENIFEAFGNIHINDTDSIHTY